MADSVAQAPQNKYALIIGISGYPNFEIDDRLKYADDDAEVFADLIKSPIGGQFPAQNVRLIKNEDATRAGIADGIDWISKRSNSNDLVYIFFAGHGKSDDGHAYYMPFDADPSNPSALGFRMDRFFEDIQVKINYKHMVFFIDACHSGSTYGQGIARGESNIVTEVQETWKELFVGKTEITMAFLSTSSNQFSWEDDEIQHGIFTFYLIKGLEGAADGVYDQKEDNMVTARELYNYVLNNVEIHANKIGHKQTPTKSPSFLPDFPFSISHSPKSDFETAYSYVTEGISLYKLEEYRESVACFEKAIQINPTYSDAYHRLGMCYACLEESNRAIESYQLSIKYDSTNWAAYFNIGALYYIEDDIQNSKSYLNRAVELNPTYLDGFIQLSFMYDVYPPYDFQRALENIKKAYELAPDNLLVLNNLMSIYSHLDLFEDERRIANIIIENLESKYTIDELYYQLGDSDARKYYINACLHMAIISLIMDNKSDFEKFYNLVIDLYNSNWEFERYLSYEGSKHTVLNSNDFDENEKILLIHMFDLLGNPKERDKVVEYNLGVPRQFQHLNRIQMPNPR